MVAHLQEQHDDLGYEIWLDLCIVIDNQTKSFDLIEQILRVVSLLVAAVTVTIVTYVNLVGKRRTIGIERAIGIRSNAIVWSYVPKAVALRTRRHGSRHRADGGTINPSTSCVSLVDGTFRGAGGNRTPVHQPVNEPATTIPGIATDAVTPTGRLSARGGPRSVFPVSHRSFLTSTVFPVVIPHFCCRAVMDWPRAALLLTMIRLRYLKSGGNSEIVVFNGNCVGCPV